MKKVQRNLRILAITQIPVQTHQLTMWRKTRINEIICWPTAVESYPKASFSIATTPRCDGELNSFPWITPLTLDLYLIMLSVKQINIKYHFWVFRITWPGIEPRPTEPLVTKFSNNFFWPIDGTRPILLLRFKVGLGVTTRNGWLYSRQCFRTGASAPRHPFLVGGSYSTGEDTVCIF